VSYLRASEVVIHYEEALYQVYVPLPYVTCNLHRTIKVKRLKVKVIRPLCWYFQANMDIQKW